MDILGHDGACDRIRQALATLGAEASILRKTDPKAAERIMVQGLRIEAVVESLEGRPGRPIVIDNRVRRMHDEMWNQFPQNDGLEDDMIGLDQ